ncbi:MAG TPA: hypothetical protein VFR10_11700, partial [bacterium]|nr:hypothetical protein [bacterium]
RDELENDKPLTNAQIRNRIAKQYNIRLSRDGQLSEFWRWFSAQQELEQSNDLIEQFEEFTRKQNPDWSPDKVRDIGIQFFMAHTTARKDANKFATIVALDQNERFGRTKAAQKERQLDQQDRKIKLLEQKAAAFDQAKGVLQNKELTEAQRAARMREVFGISK